MPKSTPKRRSIIRGVAATTLLALPGCVVHDRPPPPPPPPTVVYYQVQPGAVAAPVESDTVVVGMAPPADQVEIMPYSPGDSYIWIGGSWQWEGGGWLWEPGSWQVRPYDGFIWIRPRYEYIGGRWMWYRGGWGDHYGHRVGWGDPRLARAYHPGYFHGRYIGHSPAARERAFHENEAIRHAQAQHGPAGKAPPQGRKKEEPH